MVRWDAFRNASHDQTYISKLSGKLMSKNDIVNLLNRMFPTPDNILMVGDCVALRKKFVSNFKEVKC